MAREPFGFDSEWWWWVLAGLFVLGVMTVLAIFLSFPEVTK